MTSFRYGVLSFRHGPGIADVFVSRTLYFSAHSETLRSSGGCRYRRASFRYPVVSYLRIRILFLWSSIFYVLRPDDSGDHE